MNLMNDFIREIMVDKHLTIKEVSILTNFSEDRIAEIILKDVTPTVKEADLLLDRLEIDFVKMLR